MKLYYGLTSQAQAIELTHKVCEALGHGSKGTAQNLLLETACAETLLGSYPDRYAKNGHGLHQLDDIAVIDIQERVRAKDLEKIISAFGVNIQDVEPSDLGSDPLLSTIFCRLKYKLRPEPIPASLEARAMYWKLFYNTMKGKGHPDEYISKSQQLIAPLKETYAWLKSY